MPMIKCPLKEAAVMSSKEPALINGQRMLLYSQLDVIVDETVTRLQLAGIQPKDRVGLFLVSDWKYIVLLLALFRLQAIACPLNTRLPGKALRAQLDEIESETLIARVSGEGVNALEGLLILKPEDLVEDVGDTRPLQNVRIDLDQPATLLFTSGSGGRPCGALHSYGNHYYSARGSNMNLPLRSRDRWLLSLPLFHVSGIGIIFRCLLSGSTIVIPEHGQSWLETLDPCGVTHCSLVPSQLRDLLGHPADQRSTLKAVLTGGAMLPDPLYAEAVRAGIPVLKTYGLTETSGQVATVNPLSPPNARTNSGNLLRFREMRIEDTGEICVRGRTLFMGYWSKGGLNLPLDEEGWYHTGDLGRLDDSGGLTVLGRLDRLIISGGENIQPEEVEALLSALPGVEEALVVPVADKQFGQRPVAFIRGDMPDPGALEKQLPAYKIPMRLLEWPEEEQGLKPDRARLTRLAEQAVHPAD